MNIDREISGTKQSVEILERQKEKESKKQPNKQANSITYPLVLESFQRKI